ncbi:MAG TPA: adenylosuccinate lyase, partial [Candidatus Thermoplasmatota archaeon]|nr:adenylosuccinate lyase [Candidatus Thermoplasmatota archaeon]
MELVCPLDFRYGRPEMKGLWTEEARLRYLLRVEAALAWAHSRLGTVPADAAKRLQQVAESGEVTPQRVKEIEAEIRHDLMAVVKAMTEAAGAEAGRHVHLGATSYDVIDTANALQFRDAIGLLRGGLRELRDALLHLAQEHRRTAMLGRTHGQAAVPITFGLKVAVWASETGRHLERLAEVERRVAVGMMSGATGTMAAFRGKGMEVQDLVCERLGLRPETASTQIIQRDRYIELFSLLANIATSLEKFTTEVRTLQRTEIGEVAEGFDAKRQVGSSTMPHKQNPVVSEQVSGLCRLVRSMVLPVWENAVQWNERDLANSAPERFLHPHAFILLDHCITQTAKVMRGLRVFPERMQENLERAQGLMMAESVMIALTEKGMGRQEAHELAREVAMKAIAGGGHYRDALLADKRVVKLLG